MKKILLSSAITMVFTVSTMAQADNSSVSGVAVDSLGLPSSALLLTDKESDNTRGTYWGKYKAAKADYKAAKCHKAANKTTDKCLDLFFTKDGYRDLWQEFKAKDIANPGDYETSGTRSYSY